MTTVSDLLHVARANLGYEESPRGSNNSKFGAWYGINPAPWCAMFVSYAFYTAGHPLHISSSKGFSYCPSGVSYAQGHDLWDADGRYAPGDIVFFRFGDRVDHTGIVVDDDGSTLHSIEGNTGNLSVNNGGAVMLRTHQHGPEVVGAMRMSLVLAGGTPVVPRPDPQTVAPAWPGRMLSLASPLMHGNDIATWQNKMRSRGWKALQVDGIYGPASAQACSQFQKEKHLGVDGEVGPVTWHATWVAR